jgi:hypothetical protein
MDPGHVSFSATKVSSAASAAAQAGIKKVNTKIRIGIIGLGGQGKQGQNAPGPAPGVSRLTGYQDAARVFLWTSPIHENVGRSNVGAKIGTLISINERTDRIEIGSDCRASRLVACQSWHPLAQVKGKADFLSRFFERPYRIPPRDSYRRMLIALIPETFQACFSASLAACLQTDSNDNHALWRSILTLLVQLDPQNSIDTIDAMGCQKKIVEQIDKA